MKIITNYIGWNLLKGILTVAVLLLAIDLLFYFINELRFIGTGNYDLSAACLFVALTIPRKLYIMSPWSALIGSLLALGSMSKNSELLIIRTFGISAHGIALCGSLYVLLFTLMIFCLGEFVAPRVEMFAQTKKTLALSKGNTIYTSYGTWIKNYNNFIHISTVQDYNNLHGITIYYFDEDLNLYKSLVAESARLIEKNIWELKKPIVTNFPNNITNKQAVYEHETHGKENNIQYIHLETIQEKDLLDLNILQTTNIKHLERLSIQKLVAVIKDRVANGLAVIDYKLAFWKKIIQPFSILIMSYLAVSFVFGPLRSSNKGLRLIVGIALGSSFYLLNALFSPLVTVINFPASLAAIIPSTIFFFLAMYLTVKIDKYRV